MKLTKYNKYKNTNIQWLGDIPEHWETLPMKNLVKQIVDTEHKTVPFVEDGEYLVARTTNIKEGKLTYNKAKYTDYYGYLDWTRRAKPEEGDILFTREAPAGEACVIPKNTKLCLGQRVVLIKVYPKRINTDFCIYSIYGGLTENNIKMLSVGSTVFHFNMSDIRSLQILLPPLSEQTAIANYLDQKTAQIDRKVDLLSQKIEKYKELKKSLINETVCRGLDKNVKLKPSGIDWIGDIPEHWEVKRFKDLSEVKRGASPRPIDAPYYFDDNGEFSWVRIADLSASERYLTTTKQTLSELGASLSVKRYPNDFILSIAGTVGKPIITKIKCCIHDGFVWFPNLKINPEYLYFLFSTGLPYQGLGKLGTQLNLNTDTVSRINIPLPSKSEIEGIVTYLDEKTSKIDQITANLSQQIETLKELRKSLINEVVTGKLKIDNG